MRSFPLLAAAVLATMPPVVPLDWDRSDESGRRSSPSAAGLLLGENVRTLRAGPGDMSKPKGKRAKRRRKG